MQIPDIKRQPTILRVLAHYNPKPAPSTSSGLADHIKSPFPHQRQTKPPYLPQNQHPLLLCLRQTENVIQLIPDVEGCTIHNHAPFYLSIGQFKILKIREKHLTGIFTILHRIRG